MKDVNYGHLSHYTNNKALVDSKFRPVEKKRRLKRLVHERFIVVKSEIVYDRRSEYRKFFWAIKIKQPVYRY